MEDMNIIPIIVAALIPTIVGFLYYNPKVMGTAWMNELGKTEKELQEGFNMPVVMIVSLVLSFLLSFWVNILVEGPHKDVNAAGEIFLNSTHTFGHGAFHGLFLALLVVCPILITNSLYERKSWKLMMINCVYWIITISLMAGLTDAWN